MPFFKKNKPSDNPGPTYSGQLTPINPLLNLPSIEQLPADDQSFAPLTVGGPQHGFMPEKRSFKWLKITLLIILGLLLITYGVGVYLSNSHFGFNTIINGTDVSFKTSEEVKQVIANQVDTYQLQIEARAGVTSFIKGSEIDMKYVPDNQVDQLLEQQNIFLWPLRLIPKSDGTGDFTHASITVDHEKLNSLSNKLPMMDEANMKPPEDAKLVFINGKYSVQPEALGTQLDVAKSKQLVNDAALATVSVINLDKEGCYIDPQILSNDESLRVNMERFNKFVPFSITYLLGDKREVLDGNTTIDWVNTTGNGPYELDPAKVALWVNDFSARHNTIGIQRPIKNGYGEDKVVNGGTYGWEIDQEAEVNAIFAAATNKTGEERGPYLLSGAASWDTPDWGRTYAEVDLSAQHMWYYIDGNIVLESDVVTGIPDGRHDTTEGVFYVLDKKAPTVLRGPRVSGGKYEWEAPVNFWMAVTLDGIGFHDANWQPWFGGDRYRYGGSHGCINLPPSFAGQLYATIEVNTPVVMHY